MSYELRDISQSNGRFAKHIQNLSAKQTAGQLTNRNLVDALQEMLSWCHTISPHAARWLGGHKSKKSKPGPKNPWKERNRRFTEEIRQYGFFKLTLEQQDQYWKRGSAASCLRGSMRSLMPGWDFATRTDRKTGMITVYGAEGRQGVTTRQLSL